MTEKISNLVLVASGKGGVGKSTVSTNVALALADMGYRTGLLDADVYGPSLPTMLGEVERPKTTSDKRILPAEKYGLKLMSMGYMVNPDQAVVWRGPMLAGAVMQFVSDVDWGELDYLLFDLPPGTGDVQLSLAQKLKCTGAMLVSTPQQVALDDVVRAKAMFDKVRIPTLGLVENMSYFICSNCDERHEIFSHGGAEKQAGELGTEFLGRVPIEAVLRECGDAGEPVVRAKPESASARAFVEIAAALDATVQAQNTADSKPGLRIIS